MISMYEVHSLKKDGSVGLKRRRGQAYFWCIAILWHQKVFETNKNHVQNLAQCCPVIYRMHYMCPVDGCTQAHSQGE